MELIVFIIVAVVIVKILKGVMLRQNPSLRGVWVSGLFIAPIAQISIAGILLHEAINTQQIGGFLSSFSFIASIYDFIVEESKATDAINDIVDSAQKTISYTKYCLYVVLTTNAILLYKEFDNDKIRPLLMHLLVGIGAVSCIVSALYFANYLNSTYPVLFDKSSSYGFIGILLTLLLMSWLYFYYSLRDIQYVEYRQKNLDEELPDVSISQKDSSFDDNVEKLKTLKNLLDAGILTQEEFDSQKKLILNSDRNDNGVFLNNRELTDKKLNDLPNQVVSTKQTKNMFVMPDKYIKFIKSYIFPITVIAIFSIGLWLFHINYVYTDYWIEESVIIICALGVLLIILITYFIIKNKRNKRYGKNKH